MSPATFFQTKYKASVADHMFSPLPVSQYVPRGGVIFHRTAPTSPCPSKIPSPVRAAGEAIRNAASAAAARNWADPDNTPRLYHATAPSEAAQSCKKSLPHSGFVAGHFLHLHFLAAHLVPDSLH